MSEGVVPFVTDSHYLTPPPRTEDDIFLRDCIGRGDTDAAERFLATCSDDFRSLSASAIDFAIATNQEAFVRLILLYPLLTTYFCGPVAVAVRYGRKSLIPLLLQDPRIDPNIGAPARLCVETGQIDTLECLLQCPRINPNRGSPLHVAVELDHLDAVQCLLRHPNIGINRYGLSSGLTPLCAAIRYGRLDIVRLLIASPRIDVNRGYFWTPMQMAILDDHPAIVSLLLTKTNLDPNKYSGNPMQTPLRLAIATEKEPLVRLLLKDPRVVVSEALINELEAINHVQILQCVAESARNGEIRLGTLWSYRMALVIFLCAMFSLVGLVDLAFLSLSLRGEDLQWVGIVMITLYVLAGCGLVFGCRRRLVNVVPRWLSLVPLFPAAEWTIGVAMFRMLFGIRLDFHLREQLFVQFCFVSIWRCGGVCAPVAALRLVVVASEVPSAVQRNTVAYAFALIVATTACVLLWRVRIPTSQRQAYFPLREIAA
jgi:hypothetical protein